MTSENEYVYKQRIWVLAIASMGPLVAFSPFIIGALGSMTVSGSCNEGNCAWAALPWLMFLTIPVGFVLYCVALFMFLVFVFRRIKKDTETSAREKRLRKYQFAWMLPALIPLLGILIGVGYDFYTGINFGLAAYAFSWLAIPAVAIWNKLERNSSDSN